MISRSSQLQIFTNPKREEYTITITQGGNLMEYNPQQLEAINTIDGNVVVVASAGSGKTTVLTNRIRNMVEDHGCDPTTILAITFSRKAKEAISERLDNMGLLGVNIETFHSLALKIILRSSDGYKHKVWTTAWEKQKVIDDICKSMRLCGEKEKCKYNDIARFIATQKHYMLSPTDEELIFLSDMPYSKNAMREIYSRYEKFKESKGYIEFDDFLNLANDILSKDRMALRAYQEKFRYVLVDEFQDVSASQALLLCKLNKTNTMIVGDPLQAIYAFRGGNSKFILNFDIDYKDVKVINLNTNYRCSKDIVITANALASTIPDSKHRNYVESVANNGPFKRPEYEFFKRDVDESNWVADKIKKLVEESGYTYSDIAVLARTNAQLLNMEYTLDDNGIAFNVVEGTVFTSLAEVQLILSYIRLALDPNNNNAFSYVFNKPNRWLDKKFLEETKLNSELKNISYFKSMDTIKRRNWKFKKGIDELQEVINYIQKMSYDSVGDVVKYLRERLDIDTFVSKGKQSEDGKSVEQIENLNAFQEICSNYKSMEELTKYTSQLEIKMKERLEASSGGVNLLTIHKSKGLEFPVVFIVGCNSSLLPHYKAENIDDEKRLFYVAITRAEKELYLSGFMEYNGMPVNNSPFISDISNTISIKDFRLEK